MTYKFRVRPHPLGVVVYRRPDRLGELLIAGEECCGVSVENLERIAKTGGKVEVPLAASENCPLRGMPAAEEDPAGTGQALEVSGGDGGT